MGLKEYIEETKPPTKKEIIKSLLFLAVAVGVAYFVTVKIGIDDLRSTVASAGVYAPLVIIILKATTLVVVPLGGMPLYVIAGAVFGFWQGWFITLLGDILGSAIAFYLSRWFGRKVFYFFIPDQYIATIEKLVERMSQPGNFLKAKMFFSGFPELFAYAAGLTRVKFPIFLLVHNGIHAILSTLLIAFGGILVSGHLGVALIVGFVTSLLAFLGIWWFHADVTKSA